ncbi:MAG TPA: sigma-70 family RNA polymerase sigma factor [Phycisphaerae bacterium]|nr:sigma-70 family RNA polymerase sigma factor [Phycisphaerae bacterium]HNU46122.1 sigma-70 family RNA polymerase sigma factor [Phycisphaerae bacterium]
MDSTVATNQSGEVALVCRAQRGDAAAYTELVRSYQKRVVSVAYRLLGHSEDAADVAQEAFVRAYHNLEQLDDPERFGPWLMRVVTTQALNFRRCRKSRAAASLDQLGEGTTGWRLSGSRKAFVERDDDPDGPLPTELHAAISAALEQLPEKQRLALVLFSVEGMPQRDVAQILDCSIELVKWNVFQARQKLKDLLHEFL